jgi:L-amino acid N-acyltransferase YncA
VLCRAGVVERVRGNGIQSAMIQVRERKALALGLRRLTSYTHYLNVPSSNNLIRNGFRLCEPPKGWAGDEFLYWEKVL